jgi:succinoglycan biosynthesis protein ExoV
LANIEYVNPEQDGKAVIGRIRSAKLVIADSMHGAIIADAMRVPWIPVVTSPRINTFKWMDWTSSVGLPYAPYLLGHSSVYDLLRNSSLGLYGDRVFHPNGTPDQVLERFKRQGRIRNLAWWPWYSDAARMLLYRIPKRLLSVAVPALCDKLSRGAVESAAANLEEAKRSTSYLSEPRVFDSRIQQLLAGLEQVKRLGGGVARGLAVLASDFSMGASASVEEIVVAILRSTIC